MAVLIRGAQSLLTRGSVRQKLEWIHNKLELAFQTERVRSHPSTLIIDPASSCNLRCPFCSTGNGTLGLAKALLKPDAFAKIVSHIRVDLLNTVHLYNYGEPLLNPYLCEYIRYFAERGVETRISTNFSVKDYSDEEVEQLVMAGLSELLVSVDGATQESYEKYRVGGSLERVLGNLKRLSAARDRLGRANPRIVYQVLLSRWNEGEIDLARRHAAEIKADEFRLNENFYVPPELYEEWTASSVKEKFGSKTAVIGGRRAFLMNTECRQMWDTIVVNANGDMLPCCITDQSHAALGNLVEQHIDQIRNGSKLRTLRGFVTDPDAPTIDFPNVCQTCPHRYCTYKEQDGA